MSVGTRLMSRGMYAPDPVEYRVVQGRRYGRLGHQRGELRYLQLDHDALKSGS